MLQLSQGIFRRGLGANLGEFSETKNIERKGICGVTLFLSSTFPSLCGALLNDNKVQILLNRTFVSSPTSNYPKAMHIRKRGKTYLICISLGFDSSGKRIRQYVTYNPDPAMTPRQANQAAYKYGIEIENKLKRGGTLQYESITFNQFAEMYFKDYAPSTITETELRNWLVHDFLARNFKKEALKKMLQIIRAVFEYGIRKQICTQNPARYILVEEYAKFCNLSARSNEERSFSEADIEKLREYCLADKSNPHYLYQLRGQKLLILERLIE